ncbi:bifunctional DNA primase/polymerase [Streptomyces sp. NPDC051940]|uniref:bifunctional DNA primase/polymerase n=1 Tax=Streptomyces sp. NPDC051940 TaxID=3155675 RepID=UPI0034230114
MTTDIQGTGPALTAYVTQAGADWLASASAFPRSVLALWSARPTAPSVLPCGTVFDVVSLPSLYGRLVVDRLWSDGPGSGPVAVVRGRTLLFAAPGTAARLPSLLAWEQWAGAIPRPLCHGEGDAVTIPPLRVPETGPLPGTRWLVAPEVRHPWLPGAQAVLWACVRAAGPRAEYRFSISADQMLESSHQAPLAQLVRAADS